MTEVLPEGSDDKPRTASLFATMSPETVTLDEAEQLLTLPRTLEGSDGQEIVVSNGRYGPFVKRGSETRSLESEEQLLTLTSAEAEAILAQPKQRRGRGAPKPPLKELGPDPSSGKPLVVKDGRFGPYVTDGETNASLRRGDDVEGLTLERALELLAERRAKGPVAAPRPNANAPLTRTSLGRRTMSGTGRTAPRDRATQAPERGIRHLTHALRVCDTVCRSISWKERRIARRVREIVLRRGSERTDTPA